MYVIYIILHIVYILNSTSIQKEEDREELKNIRIIKSTFCDQCLDFSSKYTNKAFKSIAKITKVKKSYTLAGFEPGPSDREADAMSTAPRRYGIKNYWPIFGIFPQLQYF
jgi:hypothetical protein